jgi:hypothetical protein
MYRFVFVYERAKKGGKDLCPSKTCIMGVKSPFYVYLINETALLYKIKCAFHFVWVHVILAEHIWSTKYIVGWHQLYYVWYTYWAVFCDIMCWGLMMCCLSIFYFFVHKWCLIQWVAEFIQTIWWIKNHLLSCVFHSHMTTSNFT